MKVVGLNGREYNLDLKKYMNNDRKRISHYHIRAGQLIHEIFHGHNILEEVKLPGSTNPAKKSVLYLDFFIPSVKMGVEVHGEQHYTYTPFFHKSKVGFLRSQARDRTKAEWCKINQIDLVVLKYNHSEEHWRKTLERR
jgi:hypothetical protein